VLHSCVNICLSFSHAAVIRWTSSYTMFHVSTCLLTYLRRCRTTSWRRRTTTSFSHAAVIRWSSSYTMFHVSTCLLIKTLTSSSRRRRTTSWRRRHDVIRRCRSTTSSRRRDDEVRRRRTYITEFSVTFLCKYLSFFLTRCCYTVNEFIYDVSRIYLLT